MFFLLQETFTPVYYLVLIIVMKMVIPNPTYPAITTPQGSSSVMNFPKLSSNSTQIGIAPNDEKTQTFINKTVLKSSILYVSSYALWYKLLSNANSTGKLKRLKLWELFGIYLLNSTLNQAQFERQANCKQLL